MCGIAGVVSFSRPVDLTSMESMTKALSHRGPDALGSWLSNSGECALGHTRLSIIDLTTTANQPLSKGHTTIVFNGEIYNYLELKNELLKLGHHFSTQSDTEVILAAYHQWGESCFSHFNGMWAIAIWDQQKQQLLLCRDRFGVKPLFYTESSGQLVFASELCALAEHPEISLAPNMSYIELSTRLGVMTESLNETLFGNINKFPAGHLCVVDVPQASIKWQQWWDLTQQRRVVADSYDERREEFRELFLDALSLRTRSDVPLAVALSGGVDSGAVAAELGHLSDFSAFTCDFSGSHFSESADAKLIMSANHNNHHIIDCNNPSLAFLHDSAMSLGDMYSDPCPGIAMLYQKMQSMALKVSIEGHAGDELLGGYHHHFLMWLIDEWNQNRDFTELMSNLETHTQMFPELNKYSVLDALLLAKCDDVTAVDETQGAISGFLSDDEKNSDFFLNTDGRFSIFRRRRFLDFRFNTLPAILRNFDRLSMHYGVEVRSPFLDWRLVSYCFSLPCSDLINSGFSKYILRDAIPGLPDKVRWNRKKIGFASPLEGWLQNIPAREWQVFIDYMYSVQPIEFEPLRLPQKLKAALVQGDFKAISSMWKQISAFLNMDKLLKKRRH